MNESSLMIAGGRRRGRPRLSPSAPSTSLHLKLPEDVYDKACQVASKHRITVPEVIRRVLDRALDRAIPSPAA